MVCVKKLVEVERRKFRAWVAKPNNSPSGQSQPAIFHLISSHFFLASLHRAEEMNTKSWGHSILHFSIITYLYIYITYLLCLLHIYYYYTHVLLYVCITAKGDGGCKRTSLCGCWSVLAELPLSQQEQGPISMCNIIKRILRYGSPEAGNALLHPMVLPTPSATLDFIYLFYLLFTEWFTEQLSLPTRLKFVNTEMTLFGIIYSAKHYLYL